MRRLFFHEESIHEVSRRYLEPPYIHTYTHGQAETNMSPLFKAGGIKRRVSHIEIICPSTSRTLFSRLQVVLYWPSFLLCKRGASGQFFSRVESELLCLIFLASCFSRMIWACIELKFGRKLSTNLSFQIYN